MRPKTSMTVPSASDNVTRLAGGQAWYIVERFKHKRKRKVQVNQKHGAELGCCGMAVVVAAVMEHQNAVAIYTRESLSRRRRRRHPLSKMSMPVYVGHIIWGTRSPKWNVCSSNSSCSHSVSVFP